jgi:hypothetical protein
VSISDFCLPFVHFNELVSDMAKDAGYLSATPMIRGRVDTNSNRFMLPRIPINHLTLPHLFFS